MTDANSDVDLDLLRESARAFLTERGVRKSTDRPDSLDDLAAMDWIGLLVDEGRGGAGWRPVEACIIAEELGRAQDRSPWLGCVMAAAALADAPDDTRTRWLPNILSGNIIAGFGLAGNLVRVLAADRMDVLVVAGGNGVHLIELADANARHLDDDALDIIRPAWCLDLSTATGTPIGSPVAARTLLAAGRLLTSADAVGALASTVARLVAYLKDRVAFGAPIASFQAVQHRLVDLLVTEVKSRAIVSKAARTLASGDAAVDDGIMQSAVAHAFVSAKVTAAIDECMQLSGGIGFTWEYPLHHDLRRASTDAILLGTARSSRQLFAEVSGW